MNKQRTQSCRPEHVGLGGRRTPPYPGQRPQGAAAPGARDRDGAARHRDRRHRLGGAAAGPRAVPPGRRRARHGRPVRGRPHAARQRAGRAAPDAEGAPAGRQHRHHHRTLVVRAARLPVAAACRARTCRRWTLFPQYPRCRRWPSDRIHPADLGSPTRSRRPASWPTPPPRSQGLGRRARDGAQARRRYPSPHGQCSLAAARPGGPRRHAVEPAVRRPRRSASASSRACGRWPPHSSRRRRRTACRPTSTASASRRACWPRCA